MDWPGCADQCRLCSSAGPYGEGVSLEIEAKGPLWQLVGRSERDKILEAARLAGSPTLQRAAQLRIGCSSMRRLTFGSGQPEAVGGRGLVAGVRCDAPVCAAVPDVDVQEPSS